MADCGCSAFIHSICWNPAQQVWLFSFCYFVFCKVSKIILLSQSVLKLQDTKQRNRILWTWGLCCLGYHHFFHWLVDLLYIVRESAVQATAIWKEVFYPLAKPKYTYAPLHSNPELRKFKKKFCQTHSFSHGTF